MNIANVLTISRFFMACIFGALASSGGFATSLGACFVFALAALTDWADGYIARRYNMITTFGKIMDPIADKCLTLTAFFIFADHGLFPVWAVMLIAAREILVTVWRVHAMTLGRVLAAEKAGKIKTVVQMTTISLALLYQTAMAHSISRAWVISFENHLRLAIYFLMMVAVLLTVVSGVIFFRQLKEAYEQK